MAIKKFLIASGRETSKGRFEILSLTGTFTPTESGGTKSRAGGMTISLASPDGRIVGGCVAGLLIAASPVQVVVGSFLPGNHQEQKPKKNKTESTPATATAAAVPTYNAENQDSVSGHWQHSSNVPKQNHLPSPSTFQRDNWATMHSVQDPKKTATDINISLPGG
ncbi:hypothetical protein L1049_018679 [Liquidambar formosana]|uniref:AT-hook motif nuclear-localized protein n=1 Tax=Liquidambar formosana TaxID=63359 RepID=A0AAP0RAE5_LIQFO